MALEGEGSAGPGRLRDPDVEIGLPKGKCKAARSCSSCSLVVARYCCCKRSIDAATELFGRTPDAAANAAANSASALGLAPEAEGGIPKGGGGNPSRGLEPPK